MKKKNNSYNIYDLKLFKIDDFDVLLHKILKQIREILSAEAGTIYISDDESLSFNVFQNDSISYEQIYQQYDKLKNLKLPLDKSTKYLAVESYVSKKIIIVNDIYKTKKHEFLGVKEYDKENNYKTHSIITAPIIHPLENKSLGVIQLINKVDDSNNFNFNEKDKDTLSMASSLIALSIYQTQNDLLKLKELNDELKTVNEELTKKVEYEVNKNEKKSAIIFHQSKLASLGEMIGNIAHQWRQPLSGISTLASALSFSIELGKYNKDNAIESLNKIVNTTKYLSDTIDDFRDFYKIEKSPQEFNLAKNINQSVSITNASLSDVNIEIVYDLDESLTYYGYKNELKQAILNLLQNAKDAFSLNKEDKKKFIFINLEKVNNSIFIKIKDNAGGIKKDILKKIFLKNFTTKEEHNGTGIGLYMTKVIIEKSFNGTIKAENSEFEYKNIQCKGALFTIELQAK
ncbi:GAF domain-containing sensor histidine kinase [Arcobacter sp.]|uniref:GAF domain-containing sensor histidine kinase n=1 Tax=Arcobacter sp. TaxID=1872629 RepID=UPI003D0C5E22